MIMSSKAAADVPGLKPSSEENGNLDDIAKAGSFHDFLMELHKQYGPIASFGWGKQYAVSIASAELFEEQQHIFDRPQEPYTKLVPFFEPISKCMQFVNQEAGEKRRQHYCEALTKESLNKYYPPMQEVIDEIVEEWRKGTGEERIPLTQYTSRFGLKATIHALFDTVLKGHSTAEFEFWKETEEVWADIELNFMKPKTKEAQEHLKEDEKDLQKLMKKLLDDRKTSPTQPGEENLLEWIISHSDDEEAQIADIILFSMAGQYATGYFVAAALQYIASEPEVDRKLFEEIETVLGDKDVNGTSIDNLVYLRQVIDEALRLSLVTTWGSRYQDFDSKLGGYRIPKNTYVFHALGVSLKDGNVWPNPDLFDPVRFSKENSRKRSKFSYCPFGVGKRECLFRDFFYAEATVALVTILRKFKVQLADSEQVFTVVHGFVSHAKEEIFVKLLSR